MAQQLPLLETRSDDQATAGDHLAVQHRSPKTARAPETARATETSRSARTRPGQPRRPRMGDRPSARAAGRDTGRRMAIAVAPDRPEILLEVPATDWRIDDRTKEVGLAGVADARRALADALGRAAA